MNTLIENTSESFSIKRWFKNLDMTGVKYQPKIFKARKYNSISGTIITLISFFIIIYRIIMSIKIILNKTNFKVTTERDIEINQNFTVYDLDLQVCLLSTKLFKIEGVFTNYYENVKATMSSFPISNTYSLPCYFYNFYNITFNHTGELFNSLNSYNAYFTVPDEASHYDVFVIFNITYVNPNDYFKPIKLKPEYIILGALDSYPKDVVINLDKINIIHQNKLFSLFYESVNKKEEQYSSFSSYTINQDNGRYYNLKLSIEYSGWVTTYSFIGFSLEEEICSIGGLISIVSVIQNFLGRFLNRFFLDREIRKYTKYTEISYDALIGNNKLNKSFAKNINIKSTNENLTNLKIIDKSNTNIFLFKNNQNKVFSGKLINLINKNSIIPQKTIIEPTQQNSNLQLNEKTKMSNDIKINNNYNSEYYQFQNMLDYYIIYQMIKDLSLIKLLCLDSNTAQIFFKFRFKQINLPYLDFILEKENKNVNLSEGNLFFDNIYEKVNVLNSFT